MKSEARPARSYRDLVLVENPVSETERRWNRVCSQDESFWEKLSVRDEAVYLNLEPRRDLRLFSIAPDELPRPSESATPIGRWIARHSRFARILSSCPGKEEVTFYALLNRAHGRGFDATLDRMFLNIGYAPLGYRRQKVVETIRRSLLEMIDNPAPAIGFMDIGSGGGFDGLDIHRICSALPGVRYRIINIDLDEKWLALNAQISDAVGAAGTTRHRTSIFDYLTAKAYETDLQGIFDWILSCNGFADFLPDEAIEDMLAGIRAIMVRVPGRVRLVFPAALKKSVAQVWLGQSVGFNYIGRTRAAFKSLVRSVLGGLDLRFEEDHSQVICVIRKD